MESELNLDANKCCNKVYGEHLLREPISLVCGHIICRDLFK